MLIEPGAPVQALTILQPYAHLIVIGEKYIENRSWPTRYRGPLVIHAGKGRTMLDPDDVARFGDAMAFGAIVGIATLTDCVPVEQLHYHDARHEHAHGPWCWFLRDVYRCDPVPHRGAQGLWTPEAGTCLQNLVAVPYIGHN